MKLESHLFFFDRRDLTIGNLVKNTKWITSIFQKEKTTFLLSATAMKLTKAIYYTLLTIAGSINPHLLDLFLLIGTNGLTWSGYSTRLGKASRLYKRRLR